MKERKDSDGSEAGGEGRDMEDGMMVIDWVFERRGFQSNWLPKWREKECPSISIFSFVESAGPLGSMENGFSWSRSVVVIDNDDGITLSINEEGMMGGCGRGEGEGALSSGGSSTSEKISFSSFSINEEIESFGDTIRFSSNTFAWSPDISLISLDETDKACDFTCSFSHRINSLSSSSFFRYKSKSGIPELHCE